MRLGMVGLGKMGGNMVRRLARAGHQVLCFDRDPEVTRGLVAEHALHRVHAGREEVVPHAEHDELLLSTAH